jgi:hypothetical protein
MIVGTPTGGKHGKYEISGVCLQVLSQIKYNFTCGKEFTSASEECCVPRTTTVKKLYKTLRLMVDIQQTSRRNQYSLLTNTQTAMIMMTMTILIRIPAHPIQVNNFIHHKTNMTTIVT